MTEKIKRINNPLTIIAIFAALAEVNATIAIGLIEPELHGIFIWFVIGFPTLLVILFFLTLNYNTKVMYSPSDYKDDQTFVQSLYGKIESQEKAKNEKDDIINSLSNLEKRINANIDKQLSSLKTGHPGLEEEIGNIKTQLKESTDVNIRKFISEFKINIDLKDKLIEYRNYPAYFVLLSYIIESNSETIDELRKFSKEKYLSKGWEEAIASLFLNDILIGSAEKFEINPQFKEDLEKWNKMNQVHIYRISRVIEEQETENAKKLSHEDLMNRVRQIAKRIIM